MKWLSVKTVLEIHERSIVESGGDPGVRDRSLMESAVSQPRAGFAGEDLYPGLAPKAAALAFSLARNHPFVDGNKRTSYAAMMMFLGRNGFSIDATIDERERIFVGLAAGTLGREAFLAWLEAVIVRKGALRPPVRGRRPGGPPGESE